MGKLFNIPLEGDRVIWLLLGIIMVASFLSVYSASANLAFVYGKVSTTYLLLKHAFHLFVGVFLLWLIHRIPYRYFGSISVVAVAISIILLIITMSMGQEIDGANANRWLRVPLLGFSIQTSAFAGLALLLYISRCMSKKHPHEWTIANSWIIYIPLGVIIMLIFPANFSTAALLFFSSMVVLFVGKYPMKYIATIMGGGIVMAALFILTVSMMPNMSNRVDTWKARIANYSSGDKSENYQVEKAKMAISNGGLFGQGPGKSVQKNFLPQSSSDFIYAIIVEEYGMIGGFGVIVFYIFLWIRIINISLKSKSYFGGLTAFAAGFALIFQAFINMSVAVNIFPVTGQTLPLLSAGGSSIWVSCIALGIILSISRENSKTDNETEESASTAENPITA